MIDSRRLLFSLAASLLVPALLSGAEEFPRKPIKVVVPFGSGGASDTLARVLQEGLRRSGKSVQPFVILNVPGAGGTLGSRRVRNARPDGYTILNLHEAILTAKYHGTVDYGPDEFVPIASTGQAHTVVCSGPASDWASLEQVLEAATAEPGTILYGGNPGAPSHFVGLLLQDLEEGAAFQFVPLGGGAERFTKLAGGHIDLSIFSVSEFKEFRATPERPEGLRGIVYLGPERHPELPEVPTAREAGYDLVTGTTQYWWAPKGTPPDRIEVLATLLEEAMATEFVRDRYEELGIEPVVQRGEAVVAELEQFDRKLAALDLDSGPEVASLPLVPIFLGGALLMAGLLLWQRGRSGEKGEPGELRPARGILGIIIALLLYTLILQSRWLSFWLVTLVFVAAVGFLLARQEEGRPRWVGLLVLGIILGAGLEFVFTTLLVIDLP